MEQILNKLSEIEATANAIMQDAARRNRLSRKKQKNRRRNSTLHLKKKPATRSGRSVKIWPARKTPGSMSFVQKPKTSYPGWMPITKPITKVFAVSCFRK